MEEILGSLHFLHFANTENKSQVEKITSSGSFLHEPRVLVRLKHSRMMTVLMTRIFKALHIFETRGELSWNMSFLWHFGFNPAEVTACEEQFQRTMKADPVPNTFTGSQRETFLWNHPRAVLSLINFVAALPHWVSWRAHLNTPTVKPPQPPCVWNYLSPWVFSKCFM